MSKFFHSHSEKKGHDAPPAYPTPPPVSVDQPEGSFRPPQGHFGTSFACLLLSRSDRVRIIGFPENVIPAIDQAVMRIWVAGVQQKGPYAGGGYEWKVSGNPWRGYGIEAITSRRLICHILHSLSTIGWHLSFSSDLCKKQWDKDTLFFKPGPPRSRYFFSVTFNEFDKIRIIDSPNPEVTTAFQAAVSSWPLGIQQVKEKEQGCLQLKLKGNPWYTSDGVEVNYARLLGCSVLSALDAHGFELVASVDMSASPNQDYGDLDSWIFADR